MNRLISEKDKLIHMNSQLKLISNPICPFAQRAWIALLQKKCDFQFKQVSLLQKQPFFTEIYHKAFGHDPNSTGKVPILVDGDKVLCESDLISWYVAEKFDTGTQLIPKDFSQRLKMRYFIESCSKIIPVFYSYKHWKSKQEEEKKKILVNTEKIFAILQDSLVLPYACGEDFTLGDIMVYPWLERWLVLQSYLDQIIEKKYVKIHKWMQNVQERESIKATRQNNEYYISGYGAYFME